MSVSLNTFYRTAKSDAAFPPLIPLSPRCTVVSEDALDAYMAKKAAATLKSA